MVNMLYETIVSLPPYPKGGVQYALLPLLAAAIPAVAGLVGGLFNRHSQRRENARDRAFQEDMYNKTNAYNSPAEQMLRLKAAGLNPNLVYGSGNVPNTSQQMSPIPSRELPPMDFGGSAESAIRLYQDTKTKSLTNDLLEVQTMNEAQKVANAGQMFKNLGKDFEIKDSISQKKGIELSQAKELYKTTIDGAKNAVENIRLRNVEQEIKNSQMPEAFKAQILQTYANIATIKATQGQIAAETALKKELLKLNKKGMSFSDPLWMRIFSDFLPSQGKNDDGSWIPQAGKVYNNIMDFLKGK